MMIICPHCDTPYEVDIDWLGPAGRPVLCTQCEHVWMAAAGSETAAFADAALLELPDPWSDRGSAPAGPAGHEPALQAEPGGTAGYDPDLPQMDWSQPSEAENQRDWQPFAGDHAGDPPPQEWSGLGAQEGLHAGEPPLHDRLASWQTQWASGVPNRTISLAEIAIPTDSTPPLSPIRAADYSIDDFDQPFPAARRRIGRLVRDGGPATPASWRKMGQPRTLPFVVLLLFATVVALVAWRSNIVRHAPQMASLYRLIGMPVNLRGLEFADVTVAREMKDGLPVLMVTGTIVSTSSGATQVPRLRFALRNAADSEIYSWTAAAQQPVIAPGDKLAFRSRLASPPSEGQDVEVRFVNGGDQTPSRP